MAITVPVIGTEIDVVSFGKPVADGVNSNSAALAALDAAWVAFTPVLSMGGGTPGTGPIGGRAKKLGAKTCQFELTWAWGTGAFGGSGEYRWNLPYPAASAIPDYNVIGIVHCAFSTGQRKVATVHKLGNVCVVFGDWGQLTAAQPQSVQVNDSYYMSGTYETA